MRSIEVYVLFSVVMLASWATSTCASESTHDVVGWGQARWGMTEKEVLAAFQGKAKVLGEAIHSGGAKGIPDSWTRFSSIEIDSVSFSTGTFRVLFGFDRTTKRLTDVSLTNFTSTQFGRLCKDVEKSLIEKYGTPTYRKVEVASGPGESSSLLGSRMISWEMKRTHIELNLRHVEGALSVVVVSYHSAATALHGENKP